MSRRKNRAKGIRAASPVNYMGRNPNISNAQSQSNGDMTPDEIIKMMEDINNNYRTVSRRHDSLHDVTITINAPSRNSQRFTFRMRTAPKGETLVIGDKASLYPRFNNQQKRIYFVKNVNGWMISGDTNKQGVGSFYIQMTCKNEFEYFIDLYNRGVRRINLNWQFDNNAKYSYVDVSEVD